MVQFLMVLMVDFLPESEIRQILLVCPLVCMQQKNEKTFHLNFSIQVSPIVILSRRATCNTVSQERSPRRRLIGALGGRRWKRCWRPHWLGWLRWCRRSTWTGLSHSLSTATNTICTIWHSGEEQNRTNRSEHCWAIAFVFTSLLLGH